MDATRSAAALRARKGPAPPHESPKGGFALAACNGFDSARLGRWKYLKTAKGESLFDLSVDPAEKADLRSKQPATFEDVRRKYQDWNRRMLPMPAKQGNGFAAMDSSMKLA